MSDIPPEDKDGLIRLLNRLWLPVAGFLGAVTLTYNFYKMWLGDQETVTYITAGAGLVVLLISLGFVGFGHRTITRDAVWPIGEKKAERTWRYSAPYRRIAWGMLMIVFVGIASGSWLLIKHQQETKDQFVVVIATFDGPEDIYGLRNEI